MRQFFQANGTAIIVSVSFLATGLLFIWLANRKDKKKSARIRHFIDLDEYDESERYNHN
jgi:hypothetical protein